MAQEDSFYLIRVQRISIDSKVMPGKYTQLLNRAEKSRKCTNTSLAMEYSQTFKFFKHLLVTQ